MKKQNKLLLLGCGIGILLFIILSALSILFISQSSSSKEKALMDYAQMIKPKMNKAEVKGLFPDKYRIEDRELKAERDLDQRFSNSEINDEIYISMKDHVLFGEPISWLYAYFDKEGIIVGFAYGSEHGAIYRPSALQEKHNIEKQSAPTEANKEQLE
jgi:hypothetical protein